MHDHRSTVKDVGGFLQSADLMNRAFRPTVAAMLMSKTRMLLVVSAAVPLGAAGCGSTPKKAEMVSHAGRTCRRSPLVDRAKCNDKDKHVVTADTDQDKKPDSWKFFKTVDVGGQKTEVITCKQVDLNHDGKIDMVTYYDDGGSQIVLEEIDGDFDGKFDFTAYYQPEQAGPRRVRHELRSARRSLEVLRGREAGPHREGRGTTTARSTSGSTTRAASSIASATTPAARAGSTSGTARPRSRKKRRAATRPRPRAAPAGGVSARPAARPRRRRPPRRPRPAAPPPRPRSPPPPRSPPRAPAKK